MCVIGSSVPSERCGSESMSYIRVWRLEPASTTRRVSISKLHQLQDNVYHVAMTAHVSIRVYKLGRIVESPSDYCLYRFVSPCKRQEYKKDDQVERWSTICSCLYRSFTLLDYEQLENIRFSLLFILLCDDAEPRLCSFPSCGVHLWVELEACKSPCCTQQI